MLVQKPLQIFQNKVALIA
jgi:hypothetical protein